MAKYKAPPVFDDAEDEYVDWKYDVSVWKSFTEYQAEKQGPAVFLNLKGKSKQAIREITAEELSAADGVDKILARLDKVFLKDKSTQCLIAFTEFYDYRRKEGDTFQDFIIQFEKLYHKLIVNEMSLPEPVKAYFVLKAANMSEDNEKLARTVCGDLTYDNMKEKVKKIFGDSLNTDTESPSIKEEVLYGRDYSSKNRFNSGGGSGKKSVVRFQDLTQQNTQQNRQQGASGGYGYKKKCYACGSPKHLIADCPTKKSDDTEEVHITLLTGDPDDRQKSLMGQSFGKGVLDSGCSKTVCGKTWMTEFLKTIRPGDRRRIKTRNIQHKYRFGDGKVSTSIMRKRIPIRIGKRRYDLEVDVVENEIPLLISKNSMKKIGVVLDFKRDIAIINKQNIDLYCTSTGHYCLPLTSCDLDVEVAQIVLHLEKVADMDKKTKLKKARKLHTQFAHPVKEKLVKLVEQAAEFDDKEFKDCIAEVSDNCPICLKYKRQPLRPVVSFTHIRRDLMKWFAWI